MIDAAVVVSTYRRRDRLRRLVAALERQSYPRDRFEVVLVDNGSNDDTWEELQLLAEQSSVRLRPVLIEQNRGPAQARNLGWQSTCAPFVAFTDDDCVPEAGWLAEGLEMLRRDERVGVVQGCTMLPVDHESYRYTDLTSHRQVLGPSMHFEGCNLFFRRDALEQAGGFDERIGFFGEETMLGWSVLEAGWNREFAERAIVRHDLEERGLRWHMKQHFLEGNLVAIAKRFPETREWFWRPWSVRRLNALFALGVLGTVTALWRRATLLLWLPYCIERHPRWDHPQFFRCAAQLAAIDASTFAGMAIASARCRRLLL